MKIDPYKHKERWLSWKKLKKIDGVSKFNSKIITEFLLDMESGINVSSVKGGRSFIRLNSLKFRLTWVIRNIEEMFKINNITKIKDRQAVEFFNAMRNGIIKRRDGKNFTSVPDYAWVFKSFWHWYQKIQRKKGIQIEDITIDIDTNNVKEAEFCYFTVDEMKKMADHSKFKFKVLMYFLFDSGIRAPTELMNVKVEDISETDDKNILQLDIRQEGAKTFGRKIKLMFCGNLIKEYIKEEGLKLNDYLFKITPKKVNQYIKRNAIKVLGDKKTKGGKRTSKIGMYDFRHSSVCYWLPRYKSENALMYRFGWKKSNMIHHYSKLLGMKDTIQEEDMLIDMTATKIEQELLKSRKEIEIMKERLDSQKKYTDNKFKKIEQIIIQKAVQELTKRFA